MIKHGVNGILVPIKDSNAISNSVIWLLDNNEKRIEMAYSAISTSRNYSFERMGNEFIDGIAKFEKESQGAT
jgi:glycosyltransferase involved in cell wall biosynthesis